MRKGLIEHYHCAKCGKVILEHELIREKYRFCAPSNSDIIKGAGYPVDNYCADCMTVIKKDYDCNQGIKRFKLSLFAWVVSLFFAGLFILDVFLTGDIKYLMCTPFSVTIFIMIKLVGDASW